MTSRKRGACGTVVERNLTGEMISRCLLLMLFLVAAEGGGGRAKRASVNKEEDDFAEFDVADEDWDDDREATLINAPQ